MKISNWRRVEAATWVNPYGAMISIVSKGDTVEAIYVSEGRHFSEGRLFTVLPEEVPFIEKIIISKFKKDGEKYLRLQFSLRGVLHHFELKLEKKP